jgi:hypothetical protein
MIHPFGTCMAPAEVLPDSPSETFTHPTSFLPDIPGLDSLSHMIVILLQVVVFEGAGPERGAEPQRPIEATPVAVAAGACIDMEDSSPTAGPQQETLGGTGTWIQQ